MSNRTNHTYQAFLHQFIKDVLVVCPNCEGKAIVKTGELIYPRCDVKEVRVICLKCGYNKQLEHAAGKGKYLVSGAPIDPFFQLPVWLQGDFGDHLLWAYNMEHLQFLEQHIRADLRERNGQETYNSSLGSRLPKWMTAKKNREAVLKVIEKLKGVFN
ncbi:MAG: hypothetical protein K9J37_23660 [Saprospiraceae bacterium]|nr:hypothetical protein [Saprospiraceae bacterium]MCF8252924.1 hypothetical protein [Saprospiraceae bacterium]MCF8281587.1 hypothetical protein [Bacteroidales bacterium]MCF8314466.1 hypothetical protein [Saprospiraceae bacterium]MCF8443345.1 hypothetical protein [Saprospiraceae bacterium]